MPSLRGEWRYVAGLVAFFVVAAIAIGAGRDVPVIDDWTYAWSVEQLLEHGRLAVLDWSAVYPVGPALWGAGWSMAFGFSFGTLRISTLVLAAVASGALYFLLRELEASPRVALLGALTVAANPTFLLLASSFMTDVPFIAFTLLALLCYVRAVHRDEPAWLWWGGVWTCISCLERQVGVMTPVAVMPLLVRAGGMRLTRMAAAVPIGVTFAAMLAGSLAIATWMPRTSEMDLLGDRLSWLWMVSPATYFTYNTYVLTTTAFYAFPALVAMAAARGLWRTRTLWLVVAGVAVVVAVVVGEWPTPIRDRNTWTMRELGGARQLLSGEWPAGPRPWLEPALRVLGVLALALGVVAVCGRAALQRLAITPRTPILVYFAAYLGLVNVLWFYNDRYVLMLLPLLVVLALDHAGTTARRQRPSWVLAALFALVAIVGIRDTLRFNQAVRDTWQSLVDQGVPAADIDAGYAWTGWVLYAHPERLAPGQTVSDVPWVRSKRALPYRLAKAPMDGYVVIREVVWDDAAWPGPDRLYVLRQQPAAGASPEN